MKRRRREEEEAAGCSIQSSLQWDNLRRKRGCGGKRKEEEMTSVCEQ